MSIKVKDGCRQRAATLTGHKIEGKVWNVPCTVIEVSENQQCFRVTNIIKADTSIALRVLSEEKPTEASVTVTPTLEDYYLYIFVSDADLLKQ